MFLFDLLKALGVRVVLLTHSLLVVWLATLVSNRWEYWLLCIAYLSMVFEALITILVNKAQEWKWFCPCFFFYLLCTIPGIWILEIDRNEKYIQYMGNEDQDNSTSILDDLSGVHMGKNTLVAVVEQLFLYLMILARWILPRGEISRDELSQLLFVFIGIASDITELFALFEEDKVKRNPVMTYVILLIWTMSLLQFTFVLTTTNSPKKTRVATSFDQEVEIEERPESCIKMFFQSEIWSITVNFFLQDGPFLAIRLYTMISLNVLTYSIIFFTAKNGLVVMLLFYRISVVCCEHGKKENGVSRDDSTLSSEHSGSKRSIVSDLKLERLDDPDVERGGDIEKKRISSGMFHEASNESVDSTGRKRNISDAPC